MTSFSQILKQDLKQGKDGGRKFSEIKVQNPRVLNVRNRLKFGKTPRKDLRVSPRM